MLDHCLCVLMSPLTSIFKNPGFTCGQFKDQKSHIALCDTIESSISCVLRTQTSIIFLIKEKTHKGTNVVDAK